MNGQATATGLVLVGYLIGSIPFGLLVAMLVRGVDIRTVGSGNIGATNVGRLLGFRYFVLVFLLDALKGFAPAYLAAKLMGPTWPSVPVLTALAAILGHTFPIYLRLRGGKGVATSLGAVFALDPVAAGSAACAFIVILSACRYVSISSLLAGLAFALVHFQRSKAPWSPEEIAMSSVTLGLLGLLVVKHRSNLVRVAAGTEPKVTLGRKRARPSGRAAVFVVLGLAGLVALGLLASHASKVEVLDLGSCTLKQVARVATGHQRAERVAFGDGGRVLMVTCPRYNRVVLYRVTDDDSLEPIRDVALEGRPMALAAGADRFYILQRPHGDARHIEEAWWETFGFDGLKVGSRVRVGFDPDDIALVDEGRKALVLTSGRAEGEANRPSPALTVYDLTNAVHARVISRMEFNGPKDDPERLSLSTTGQRLAVTLRGTEEVAAIDLSDAAKPTIVGRWPIPPNGIPYVSAQGSERIVMPIDEQGESLWLTPGGEGAGPYFVRTDPVDSVLEVVDATRRVKLGRLPLRGAMNLGSIRPLGLAASPRRGLLAVAGRDGGAVHLLKFESARGPALAEGTRSDVTLAR
ncbi:glycerol-3-phosphate 1-O-acyltransferase PlsY [Isosphaeraceae bacterium EP7]